MLLGFIDPERYFFLNVSKQMLRDFLSHNFLDTQLQGKTLGLRKIRGLENFDQFPLERQ